MTSTPNNRNNLLTIAIVAIIALLGLSGYLIYHSSQLSRANQQLTTTSEETSKLKLELETQYNEALTKMDEMKGDNEQMNKLIEEQKTELTKQKDQISGLIRTKTDLANAKAKLNGLVNTYLAQIEELKTKNELLTKDNENLNVEKTQLSSALETEKKTTQELATAKAALVSEKENLTSVNEKLSTKVTRASVINVSQVQITGLKIDKKNKEHKKSYAKNIDRLKVCFDAAANEIADGGTESFYIRMINPIGETLAREDMGSGTLTATDTKEKIRYTTVKEIQYGNKSTNVCLNWDQAEPLAKGVYQVEIYNKGYLAGKSSFKLK